MHDNPQGAAACAPFGARTSGSRRVGKGGAWGSGFNKSDTMRATSVPLSDSRVAIEHLLSDRCACTVVWCVRGRQVVHAPQ